MNSQFKELSDGLLVMADGVGLCQEFKDKWHYNSIDELIELFKANPDWCLERGYPSLAFMEEYFNNEETRAKGIYVSQNLSGEVLDEQVYIFVNCTGKATIRFDMGKCIFPMIYMSQRSDMEFIVNGSITPIELYDDSKVHTECINGGKVKVRQNKSVHIK